MQWMRVPSWDKLTLMKSNTRHASDVHFFLKTKKNPTIVPRKTGNIIQKINRYILAPEASSFNQSLQSHQQLDTSAGATGKDKPQHY